jgi:asparagine synthase (glutamine-hydrolysing)
MESRPAFLDHHLAELARRIPPRLRIRDGVEKWILREAMKSVLPRSLYERQKFAFMAPPSRTNHGNQRAVEPLVRMLLDSEAVTEAGLLDAEQVESFLQRWRTDDDAARSRRQDIILNHLLGLQILHQEFVQSEPRLPALSARLATAGGRR